jgi:acyl-CoA thioester hydrolase
MSKRASKPERLFFYLKNRPTGLKQEYLNMSEILNTMPESLVIARFSDCDPFGHLNNARYLDYFLNAREDHLMHYYNFPLFQHTQQHQMGWVVTHTEISYLRPVKVTEEVIIRTCLINFSDSEITVEGAVLDKTTRKLKALCWMQFTYVSLQTGRTVTHSDDLRKLFASVQLDQAIFEAGFRARVEELRKVSAAVVAVPN